MDIQTVLILITIIGCFLSLAGWLSTRDKKISNDGEWRGMINAKLDAILGIDKRVDALENEVKEQGKEIVKIKARAESNTHRIDKMEGKNEN
ncbi:hypothetical protein [Aminipila sp.]|uniref:hypothetical protein n=1 Tax=Aminipila sp. TaxID=2060095 RepID=UPI0028A019C3|nr:hypothetical protein [Aminipila sp.]